MPMAPAITDLEQLKHHPAIAKDFGLESGRGRGRQV